MKLPRLQLHLLTCVVLMFVAGGLLWANLRPTTEYPGYSLVKFFGPGWPRPIFELWVDVGEFGAVQPNTWWNGDWYSFFIAMLVNGPTGLAILAVAAVSCEFVLRRREARAP